MRHWLAIAPLLSALAGCGVYYTEFWVRPGGTEAQYIAAATGCGREAEARFPPMTLGRQGWFETPNTWCTQTAGGPNCSIINPGYLPQAQSAADTNEGARNNAFHACMLAGGWQPVAPGASGYLPPAAPPERAVSEALSYCRAVRGGGRDTAGFDRCVTARVRALSGRSPPA